MTAPLPDVPSASEEAGWVNLICSEEPSESPCPKCPPQQLAAASGADPGYDCVSRSFLVQYKHSRGAREPTRSYCRTWHGRASLTSQPRAVRAQGLGKQATRRCVSTAVSAASPVPRLEVRALQRAVWTPSLTGRHRSLNLSELQLPSSIK